MKISKGPDVGTKEAFTLVELLIVMAIIAVLVGITIAGLGFAMRRSRNIARMSAMTNLERAITSYYSDNLEYVDEAIPLDTMVTSEDYLDPYLEGSWEFPAGTVIFYNSDANEVYYTFCINQEQNLGADDLFNCTGAGIGQDGFVSESNDVTCTDGGVCGTEYDCDSDECD